MRRSQYNDRIVFNGHDLSNLVMCRMERPIMPPVEISQETIGGRQGEMFRRARMTGYTVPVTIWLRAKDRRKVAELRHRLADLLWTEEPAPLRLPDDPTRYHLAIVSGDTNLGAITDHLPSTVINFYVCDPIAYGKERSDTLVAGTQKTIVTGGTWKAAPIIRSTTSGGTWKIANVTTGEFVEINADTVGTSIASGLPIVCDMENELLTLNGSYVGVTVSSDFFSIEGRKELLVTGGTNTTIGWRERWK
jgi:predicted phage tail component-like protein